MSKPASMRAPSESSPADSRAYHRVRFTYDPRRAVLWRVVAGYVQRFIDPERGLLELGAGYGEFSRFIQAKRKWALDLNEELIEHWAPEVEPLIQSALDPLPLADACAGSVFASNFFEHFTVSEGEKILAETRRVLDPGGRLVVVQPNYRLEPRRYFDDYTHKAIYTDSSFADFLEAQGWRVVHREGRFLPFTIKSRLPVCGPLISFYLSLPFRPLAGQFLIVAERPTS